MTTTITHIGKTPTTNYHAEVKTWVAPRIEESYMNDEGEIVHILANGNTSLATKYAAMWGVPKTKIHPKGYKGKDLDGRRNWI